MLALGDVEPLLRECVAIHSLRRPVKACAADARVDRARVRAGERPAIERVIEDALSEEPDAGLARQ
jgi:hypothetical protein